ncbi:MAG: carbon-nitrogen hydrolase family protein [Nitrososphaera sp.]|uniref:Putative carbon-nitrogen hydrolase n=1 Tax=Nitrososphaera gargensis (strain Ga9.2) TaxID=1237085 RepID=K0ILA0_NITGG|nr:carbon-nitrogen hydrolase family protein [Candidatus Nitrososphaera gargensis]AFU56964.1 putative carbon-nitrogen hydrolase [Candidatus Nitrososphaera gargensis Ga9.2]
MEKKKKKRVALVQMRSSEDKQKNLDKSIEFIAEAAAKGADLVCFPEFQMAFSPGSQSAAQLAAGIAETVRGNFVSKLAEAAKKNNIGVIATIYEKSGRFQRVYDTAVMIRPAGKVSSVYRKLHLYNALGFKESAKLVPGKNIAKPAKTNAGSVGLLICYDLRFPELSRILTVKGADFLVAPSAWVAGEMKEEHWQTMVKARAIENGSYVVAPDQVGNIYCGRSMAVDPFGVVLVDMGQREGVEVIEIDKSRVQQVRKSLPLLKNRRTDVYRLLSY